MENKRTNMLERILSNPETLFKIGSSIVVASSLIYLHVELQTEKESLPKNYETKGRQEYSIK
jgi:hypothetical protein